jgi:hypothetical protein
MKAIVRKRQQRRLIENDKRDLAFSVRGMEVDVEKIDRWMKRNKVSNSFLYNTSPMACRYRLNGGCEKSVD